MKYALSAYEENKLQWDILEISKDHLIKLYKDDRLRFVCSYGDGKIIQEVKVTGDFDSRGQCHQMAEEAWTRKISNLKQLLNACKIDAPDGLLRNYKD